MAVYPSIVTDVPSNIPFQWSLSQQVISTKFENGVERRRLIRFGRSRVVSLQYQNMYFTFARTIYDFYSLQKGPLLSFKFFFPEVSHHLDEYAGYAQAGQTILILPCKLATDVTIKQDGVEISTYTYHQEAGPDGEDTAELWSAAPEGANFTISFTGILKIKARFGDEPLNFSEVKGTFSSLSVTLVQLQPTLWE